MGVALGIAASWRDIASDALEQVEVLDVGRTNNLLQRNELGDGCHLAAPHLYEDIVQRLRVETIFGRRSSHDAVDLTKLVEVTDVCTTAESS